MPGPITNFYIISKSNISLMTSTSKKPAASKKKAEVPAIEKEIVIKAPVEKVWAALKVSLKVGGKYRLFGGVTTGKFTAIKEPSMLEYTWRQAEWDKDETDTLVRWELAPEGKKKTRLRLVHSGFDDQQGRDDHDEGWDVYFLGPMKEWLESQ